MIRQSAARMALVLLLSAVQLVICVIPTQTAAADAPPPTSLPSVGSNIAGQPLSTLPFPDNLPPEAGESHLYQAAQTGFDKYAGYYETAPDKEESSEPAEAIPGPAHPLPTSAPFVSQPGYSSLIQVDEDWKKYCNPAFGYSLRYPPTMFYREWNPAADILNSVSFYLIQDSERLPYQVPEITVSTFANPQQLSFREWFLAHSDRASTRTTESSAAFFQDTSEPLTVTVDGLEALAFKEAFGSVRAERLVLARDGIVFSISYTDFGDGRLGPVYQAVVSTLQWSTATFEALNPSAIDNGVDDTSLGIGQQALLAPLSPGYRLPWSGGDAYHVVQGWGGSTHACPGQMCYAYDFDNGGASFEGAILRASDRGSVAFIKNDISPDTCGGYDFRNLANYVTVDHGDGVATLYLHLGQVNVGHGSIGQGDIVGFAGKTGWTGCYPHLHFQRQSQGSWIADSVPTYFDEYPGVQLQIDQWVTSQNGSSSACSAPSLQEPSNDHTETDRVVVFHWDPPSTCPGLDVYTFRIVDDPSKIDSGPWVIDHGIDAPGTNTTETFDRDGDFWWAVWPCRGCKSGNPNYGERSAVWHFRIDTSSPPPSDWHIEYYGDNHLGNKCYDTHQSGTYVFGDWHSDAPASGCPSDYFSVRFSRSVYFPGGDYTFALGYDDGARIKVDGQAVVDGWAPSAQHYEPRNLSSGHHNVEVEYYENTGDAYLTAFWWGSGLDLPRQSQDNSQWYAQYWGNRALWWDPVVRVNEGRGFLNHQWDSAGPGYNMPVDRFSSRFERTEYFACGRWRFNISSDDGVRFWIDSNLILDAWREQVASFSSEVDLSEGDHQLRLEHYENGGSAAIQVNWEYVLDTCTQVELFSQANYQHRVFSQGPGFHDNLDADSFSMKIPDGWSVKTWRGNNRGGEERCWWESVPNLEDHGWHLAIRSIEIYDHDVCPHPVRLNFTTGLGYETDVEIVVTAAGDVQDWLYGAIVTSDSQGNYGGGLLLPDSVKPGRAYDIYAKPRTCLRKKSSGVQLNEGTNTVNFSDFLAGDTNWDNAVNELDVLLVLKEYGQSGSSADVNGDGKVNSFDYALVAINFGEIGEGWTDSGPSAKASDAMAVGAQDTIEAQATRSITLTPDSGTFSVGATFDVEVLMDTGGYSANGVDLVVLYDPGVLGVQDAEPITSGVQIAAGSIYSTTRDNRADPSLGEIRFSADGTAFGGSGRLATITFKVIASISDTVVAVYYRDGQTAETNIVESRNVQDILGRANTAHFRTIGSPSRPMPSVSFTPFTDAILNSWLIELEAEASDPYNQITEVRFEANLDGEWTTIGTDTCRSNGWGAVWDASSVPDGSYALRATALLLGGEGTTVINTILLDRTPPAYAFSTFTPPSAPSPGVPVTIEVTATDEGSGVDRIDIYLKRVDDNPGNEMWDSLGSIRGSQGSLVWDTSSVLAGTYQIALDIYDRAGNQGPEPRLRLFFEVKEAIPWVIYLPLVLHNFDHQILLHRP